MYQFFAMMKEAAAYASKGSLSKARALVQVPGTILLWLMLWIAGRTLEIRNPLLGQVVVFIASAAIVWVLIFATRFLLWPWSELIQARARLSALLAASPLEIFYDPDDPQVRFVRPHGTEGRIHYWVGVRNGSARNRTLRDVTLRALAGEFTSEVLAVAAGRDGDRDPVLKKWEAIHPGVMEPVELFGVGGDPSGAEHAIGRVGRFTLEARAQDAQVVTAAFEYDPSRRPAIRLLR